MSNIAALSVLAYVNETTAGTPPADATAWETNGQRIRHLAESLDPAVERSLLPDMRNQTRIKAVEARVQGIDNPEFSFSVYGHGLGGETNSGSQAATTLPGYQLALLLSHALGGIRRGYSDVVSGGTSTTTVVAVNSAAALAVGDFVAIELNSTVPAGFAAGTAWVRRITAIDTGATPHTITLDQALPAAPADTDPVHACVMVYFDQDVLANSAGASNRTRTWLVQKGLPSAGASIRESWEFRGTVAELQNFSLTRNELMQFAFRVMAGSHASPDTAPWPATWSNAEAGLAPLAVSPITEVWLEDQATTTNTRVHVSSFEVEPGIPRVRNETVTSTNTYLQATYGYSTEPAETVINMAVTPFGIDQWTDQVAATARKLRWSRLGPAGSGFAVHFEYVSHIKTPARVVKGANTDVSVSFMAHEVTAIGTSELQRAGMVLVMW